MKKYTFAQWVKDSGGVTKVASRLGCVDHTVRVWLRGKGAPKTESVLKIVKHSKGELSFEGIVKETTKNKLGKK